MAAVAGGAMKRPAPDGVATSPVAKARIAKSSPVAKAPVAKAPVAKAPVAKAPAQPAAQAADGEAPRKKDTWKEFENVDPLYALIGQVSNYKVLSPDGVLSTERLDSYLDKIFMQKAAKKPKDWVEIWAAMDIPVNNQVIVWEPIMAYGLEHVPETMGKILAELLKGHRLKTKTIEEGAKGAFNGKPDRCGILREFLYIIFPKGPQSEWGWSRVGWSWQQWWQMTENLFSSIEKTSAFDGLAALLDQIEADGKTPLAKQPLVWNEKRLGMARALLCKFGDLEDENDLVACLDATLR